MSSCSSFKLCNLERNSLKFFLFSSDVSPSVTAICLSKRAISLFWSAIFFLKSLSSFSFCNNSFCLSMAFWRASFCASSPCLTYWIVASLQSFAFLIISLWPCEYSRILLSYSSSPISPLAYISLRSTCICLYFSASARYVS